MRVAFASGRQILSVPARPIPAIVRELLLFYREARQSGESFNAWVTRTPDKAIVERLKPLADVENAPAEILWIGATRKRIR